MLCCSSCDPHLVCVARPRPGPPWLAQEWHDVPACFTGRVIVQKWMERINLVTWCWMFTDRMGMWEESVWVTMADGKEVRPSTLDNARYQHTVTISAWVWHRIWARGEEYIPPILMTLAMVISCDPWYLVPVVSAGLSTLCQLLYDYHDNTPPRYFVKGERWKIGKTNFQSAKSLCKWF